MPPAHKYLSSLLIALLILLSARTATAQNAFCIPDSLISAIPELIRNPPLHPDTSYRHCQSCSEFGLETEAGQDIYYSTYAYLLEKKNTGRIAANQRDTLTKIFNNINGIYEDLEHSGSYYFHQYVRIPGYVEYSIYSWRHHRKTSPQKITKKQLLSDLRDEIARVTEESSDEFTSTSQIKTTRNRLQYEIDDLAKLIANPFYLQQAINFNQKYRLLE
jgi:hypothetical protein